MRGFHTLYHLEVYSKITYQLIKYALLIDIKAIPFEIKLRKEKLLLVAIYIPPSQKSHYLSRKSINNLTFMIVWYYDTLTFYYTKKIQHGTCKSWASINCGITINPKQSGFIDEKIKNCISATIINGLFSDYLKSDNIWPVFKKGKPSSRGN